MATTPKRTIIRMPSAANPFTVAYDDGGNFNEWYPTEAAAEAEARKAIEEELLGVLYVIKAIKVIKASATRKVEAIPAAK